MNEAQIKSVALFFYFSFADKALAFSASTEALHLFEKKTKGLDEDETGDALVVFATYKIWKKYSKKKINPSLHVPIAEQGWLLPAGLKMEQWWQFVKDTEAILSLTLIWSIILKFSDKDIAEGLGASEGTIRYRTGRALKDLGSIATPPGGLL